MARQHTTPADAADAQHAGRARSNQNYNSFPVYNTIAATLASSQDQSNGSTIPDASASKLGKPARVLAPDLLRGLLMVIMAMDHVSVNFGTWEHGTGRSGEQDGVVIKHWNYTTAFVVRTLTHLCGPGFTFLLGMGIVYLGNSRVKIGWGAAKLTRYFAIRMFVLTALCVVFGITMSMGHLWFVNPVVLALGVDYFLVGMLWLLMTKTEPLLASAINLATPEPESEGPSPTDEEAPLFDRPRIKSGANAESISWHIHNAFLAILSIVTIFWNIWMSENGGHCSSSSSSLFSYAGLEAAPPISILTSSAPGFHTEERKMHPLLKIWFWPVMGEDMMKYGIMSGFPPMAWISFAILGLLYGRLVYGRPWTRLTTTAHALAGAALMTLFVMTRVFRFGNLSEGCLQTPEHNKANRHANPYLVSPQSFLYIVKYPPDVAFWAATMSVNFLLLAFFGALPVRLAKRMTLLLDLGGAALFFYIAHMYLILILSLILLPLFGHKIAKNPLNPIGEGYAITNLYGYYAIWLFVIAVMWPSCRWYGRFKSTKGADSLWRFF